MASLDFEVVVAQPVSAVSANLEAFLWEDDARVEEDHEPGSTTAVRKVDRTTFEEDEQVDMGFGPAITTTTRYSLSADPRGTRVAISCQVPAALEMLIEMAKMMGEDVVAEMQPQAQAWAGRLEAFVGRQQQLGSGEQGVA